MTASSLLLSQDITSSAQLSVCAQLFNLQSEQKHLSSIYQSSFVQGSTIRDTLTVYHLQTHYCNQVTEI